MVEKLKTIITYSQRVLNTKQIIICRSKIRGKKPLKLFITLKYDATLHFQYVFGSQYIGYFSCTLIYSYPHYK